MDWQEFYDKLRSTEDAKCGDDVEEFVDSRKDYEEDHHVDLKEYGIRDGRIDSPTKGNLAKEASAFANAEGGLIIWGFVDDGSPKQIDDAVEAARKLHSLGGECTEPPIDGIETIAALSGNDGRQGYAVTFVPRSEHAPHQAAMGPPKVIRKYYRRSGGRARVLLHGELDDMFGRRPRPCLVPHVCFGIADNGWIDAVWMLENSGAAAATGVVLDVSTRVWWPGDGGILRGWFGQSYHRALQSACWSEPFSRGDDHERTFGVFIPITGRPIPSHGGQEHLLKTRLDWPRCEGVLKERRCAGDMELRFDWALSAIHMRPVSGGYAMPFIGDQTEPVVARPGAPRDQWIKGKPGDTVELAYTDQLAPQPGPEQEL